MSTSRLSASLVLLVLFAACDHRSPGIEATPTTQAGVRTVRLMDFALPLHFVRERRSAPERPLVLFATGDGGWRGIDQDIVGTMVRLGYPVAGFSARDYLDHLDRLPQAATSEHVGTDYSTLIAEARQALGLSAATPIVLSGFSRGAALAVIAAGDARVRPSLRGVLAMGLGDVEEHVRAGRAPTPLDLEVLKPYDVLKGLGTLSLSVIQSTRDRFLDAAAARRLFGADTARRRLHAIDAQSHTFGGAEEQLFLEVGQSLAWIEHGVQASSRPPARPRPRA